MNISGRKWLNAALNFFIILSTLTALYVLLIGDIALRLGEARLTCHHLLTPLFYLIILLLLKLTLAGQAPFGRMRSWLERNRRTILLALLIAAASALPRFWNLGGHSLEPDELPWIAHGKNLIANLRAREFKKATSRLSYPGVLPAALIGSSHIYLGKNTSRLSSDLLPPLVAARFPIALVGTATCLLLYLLGRIAWGDETAFWAALVLSFYPPHIALSRIAHVDSTLTLCFMLSLLCYLIYTDRRRLPWKIASSICFALALLTKATAVSIPLILLTWKAVACIRKRDDSFRFWEVSDLGWLGLALALYFLLFTRLWYEPQEIFWSNYVRYLPPTAGLIATINMLAALPWLQTGGVLLCAYVLFTVAASVWGKRATEFPASRSLRSGASLLFLCFVFIQIFRKPIVNELLHLSAMSYLGDIGHVKYWMGRIVTHPPGWFYLFMLLICTPPLMLLLLVSGLIRPCVARSGERAGERGYLLCLIASVMFITIMSLGHKMAFRYIAPVIPCLCLISASGLAGIMNCLPALALPGRAALRSAIVLPLIASLIVPLVTVAPSYGIYCNFLVGGPAGASHLISLGFGVGTKEAVAYLKAHAKSGDSIFAVGIAGDFRYHWAHDPPAAPPDVLINAAIPSHGDWLVIPLGHRMRNPSIEKFLQTHTPKKVYTVTKCGVGFVDIYRLGYEPASVTPQ